MQILSYLIGWRAIFMQLGSVPMKIMGGEETENFFILGGLVIALISSACLQVPKECIHSFIHEFDMSNNYCTL